MNASQKEFLDAAELGFTHPMTQKAMENEDPGLVMHAQGNGILMALVQGQAIMSNNTARALNGIGWIHLAQLTALLMILWRVW